MRPRVPGVARLLRSGSGSQAESCPPSPASFLALTPSPTFIFSEQKHRLSDETQKEGGRSENKNSEKEEVGRSICGRNNREGREIFWSSWPGEKTKRRKNLLEFLSAETETEEERNFLGPLMILWQKRKHISRGN